MSTGNNVQITIDVVDNDAAGKVQQVAVGFGEVGAAGEAAGAAASAGLDQISTHSLTALDNVRLLRDDLGIRIPRSMEKAIANSQLLSGAIGGIGGGLLAVGAVDIFVRLGEGAYNLYEKYLDVNAAQREFMENLQKSKDADFVNVHSIETARQRIDAATSSMTAFREVSQGMSNQGWLDIFTGNTGMGVGELLIARQMSDLSAKGAGQTQELIPEQNSLRHQLNVANIEAEHSGDAALKGQSKITAELEKQLELHKETQRYTSIEERQRGNIGSAGAGSELEATQDKGARAQAAAERLNQQREETNQIIQMQNEATNAGLTGNALQASQQLQEIAAVHRAFEEGEISKQTAASKTDAVLEKFYQMRLKEQEQLDQQTRKMADDAAQAGLKGIPLIQAQLKTQLDAINAAESTRVGTGGVETPEQTADYNSQRASASQIANQKMIEDREQFSERIRALDEGDSSYMLQGYAKIEAETQKHLDALNRDYEEEYGKDRSAWAGYQQQITQIEGDADRERQQLHHKTMEQIQKEEEQTARTLLPPWQQSQLAIEDEYRDRVTQITQDIKQHVMTEQEGAQAVTAAWQAASAQMQKDAEETRDKLASSLSSLFSNPEQFFEKRAMDAAFQMMANDLMSYFKNSGAGSSILQWLFGMGPEMSTSANPMTDIKSLFGGSHGGGIGAGASLTSAGSTLMSAGQLQLTAAAALQSAAGALQLAGGGGGLGGLPSSMGFGGTDSDGTFGGAGSDGMSSASSLSLAGGGGAYTTAAGNQVIDASSLPGGGESSSLSNDAMAAQASPGDGDGKFLGAAGAAVTGAVGIYSAYENSNPIAGLASGAIAGAEVGSLFGPVGMGVGAIIGGLAGLFAGIFGDQGRGKAESLDVNTLQPALAKEMQDFEAGRTGYEQAVSDLSQMEASAKSQTDPLGSGARRYFTSNIEKEFDLALASLAKQERGGRSAVTLSAAQYHSGGWTGDFGDFDMGNGEGFARLLANEFVVQPMAAQQHGPLLSAINAGNVSYARTPQPLMPAGAGGGPTVNVTIQAMDAKSVAQWAKAGGSRALIAAINQGQRQYSGVGRG